MFLWQVSWRKKHVLLWSAMSGKLHTHTNMHVRFHLRVPWIFKTRIQLAPTPLQFPWTRSYTAPLLPWVPREELILSGPLRLPRSLDLICSLCCLHIHLDVNSSLYFFPSQKKKIYAHQTIHETNGLSWTDEGEHRLGHKRRDLLFSNENNLASNK